MGEYLGFKNMKVSGDEVNDLYLPESNNTFGCIQNEYMIAVDENENLIDLSLIHI